MPEGAEFAVRVGQMDVRVPGVDVHPNIEIPIAPNVKTQCKGSIFRLTWLHLIDAVCICESAMN